MNDQDLSLILSAMAHLDHQPGSNALRRISGEIPSDLDPSNRPMDLDPDLPTDTRRKQTHISSMGPLDSNNTDANILSGGAIVSHRVSEPTGPVLGGLGEGHGSIVAPNPSSHSTCVILSQLTAMAKRTGRGGGGRQTEAGFGDIDGKGLILAPHPNTSVSKQEKPLRMRTPSPDPTDPACLIDLTLDLVLDPVRVNALISRLAPRLPSMTGPQLSALLHALARLQHRPQRRWIARLLPLLRTRCRGMDAGQLAGMLWSLVSSSHRDIAVLHVSGIMRDHMGSVWSSFASV